MKKLVYVCLAALGTLTATSVPRDMAIFIADEVDKTIIDDLNDGLHNRASFTIVTTRQLWNAFVHDRRLSVKFPQQKWQAWHVPGGMLMLTPKTAAINLETMGLNAHNCTAIEDPLRPASSADDYSVLTALQAIMLKKNNPHGAQPWNLFFDGHGSEGCTGSIIGMEVTDFRALLDYCEQELAIDHLMYNSCFAGGIKRTTAFEHKTYPFTILSFSSTEESTRISRDDIGFDVHNSLNFAGLFHDLRRRTTAAGDYLTIAYKNHFLAQGREYINFKRHLRDTFNKQRYVPQEHSEKKDYGAAYKEIQNQYQQTVPLEVVNMPLVRLPNQSHFSVSPAIEQHQGKHVMVIHPDDTKTVTVPPITQAIVLETDHVTADIIIPKKSHLLPKFVAMPLVKRYTFSSLQATDITFPEFCKMFALLPEGITVTFDRVTLHNDPTLLKELHVAGDTLEFTNVSMQLFLPPHRIIYDDPKGRYESDKSDYEDRPEKRYYDSQDEYPSDGAEPNVFYRRPRRVHFQASLEGRPVEIKQLFDTATVIHPVSAELLDDEQTSVASVDRMRLPRKRALSSTQTFPFKKYAQDPYLTAPQRESYE